MVPRAVRTRLKPLGELSRWLQHGLQSSQDGSKTAQGASKTPLRRLQDRPRTSQDASRAAPSAPRTSPRLSKILQDGSVSLQDVSKSSPEEVFETPSRLQELSGGAFQASSLLETLCCKQEVFGNGLGSAGIATRLQFVPKPIATALLL